MIDSMLFLSFTGRFKDECVGKPITEAIFIRPKVYSLLLGAAADNSVIEKKRAKGVKKAVVSKNVRHENYLRAYYDYEKTKVDYLTFRSKRHDVNTIFESKNAVSLFDNKRWWVDKNQSIPFGARKRPTSDDDGKEQVRTFRPNYSRAIADDVDNWIEHKLNPTPS